jgi:hypothetical protein
MWLVLDRVDGTLESGIGMKRVAGTFPLFAGSFGST